MKILGKLSDFSYNFSMNSPIFIRFTNVLSSKMGELEGLRSKSTIEALLHEIKIIYSSFWDYPFTRWKY